MKLLESISPNVVLLKEGFLNYLEINVVSDAPLDEKNNYKAVVNRNIGNNDTFQYLGIGSTEISFNVFFKDEKEYYEFYNFVKVGEQCIIICSFFPAVPINILEFSEVTKYFNFFGSIKITITDALNPALNTDNLFGSYLDYLNTEKASGADKKSLFDKMTQMGEKIFKFVGGLNEKIAKFTGAINDYANAISNICQGIASSQTVITAPLDSVKNSVDVVLGGVSAVFNAFSAIKNTVINTPNDVKAIMDRILLMGDTFKDLFKSGNKKADLEYSNNFLQDVSNTILKNDFNEDIAGDSYNANDLRDRNDCFKVFILTSLIIGIYENTNEIQSMNLIDLQKLRNNTEKIYNYIISKRFATNDFKMQLDLFRIAFYKQYNYLYNNSQKIVEINCLLPTSILTIVYKVNGNLNYLDDTIKLNNIFNVGNVIGKIKVISDK
jgi:hypothetical protein